MRAMSEEPDPFQHSRMSLGGHLDELRSRLIRGTIALAVAFALSWSWRAELSVVVMGPFYKAANLINSHWTEAFNQQLADDPTLEREQFFEAGVEQDRLKSDYRVDERLTAFGPTEGFLFQLRVCLYTAFVVGGPVLMWQLWQFIAAGLYKHERRAAMRYFPYSVLLFAAGVSFGYFMMIPYAMYYLGIAYDPAVLKTQFRLQDYFSLVTALCLALAVVFQLPVVMTFFARIGLVEPATLARFRGHFIIGSFVLAAVLTPPDPFTQCLLAVPMMLLFQIGLWASKIAARPRSLPDLGDNPSA